MNNKGVIDYCKENSNIEIQDIFKFLYQSCFGPEHLVEDYELALKKINEELKDANKDNLPEIECLDGNYCRVHLKALNNNFTPEMLCKMFINSSIKEKDGLIVLKDKLKLLVIYAKENMIPFKEIEITEEIKKWENNRYSPVHHSHTFKKAHNPSYRVVSKEELAKNNFF